MIGVLSVMALKWERRSPRDLHALLVEGQPLGLAACRANAPDVAFIERKALDEVDEGAVGRPDGKVVVDAWRRRIDLVPTLLVGLGDEHGIASHRRVVHDASAVGRPIELGNARQVGSKSAANRGDHPPAIDQRVPSGVQNTIPDGDE